MRFFARSLTIVCLLAGFAISGAMPVAAQTLVFSKAFSPAAVGLAETSRLTFRVDNSANSAAVGRLAFTDDFPSGMLVASRPNASNSCGGTLTAAALTRTMSLNGGAVAAGEVCTISVDVISQLNGALENVSGALTSDLPFALPGASATLTVTPPPPLSVSMSFSPATIPTAGVSRLTYELRNDSAVTASRVSLSDTLPTNVVVANTPNVSSTCFGGTVSAAAGGRSISWFDGRVGAGETCTLAVNVTSAVVGSYPNSTERATSSLGASTPASATLTVALGVRFTKAFSPAEINSGGESLLTFTIDNSANSVAVGGLAFTDHFPSGMSVVSLLTNRCGSRVPLGGTFVMFSGGRIGAGQTCTISVRVRANRGGEFRNVSGGLSSDLAFTTPGARATLTATVEPPLSVSMSFEPAMITGGEVSRLTYELRNDATVDARSFVLVDTLPAGVRVAAVPVARGSNCSGLFPRVSSGSNRIEFTATRILAGETCTLGVNVTSMVGGLHRNRTETVRSSLGDSAPAEATLTVFGAPRFTKTFSPATVDPGETSRLTWTIDNSTNVVDVSELAFDDTFPDGLVLAPGFFFGGDRCGGTPSIRGNSIVLLRGGSLVAGQTCSLFVDVVASRAGALESVSGVLSSELSITTPGASATTPGASATLTVNEAPLSVSMSFSPPAIDQGRVSRLRYELRNDSTVTASEVSLSDTLPDDVIVADPSRASWNCRGGILAAVAGDNQIIYLGGELGALANCTLSVDVTSAVTGSHPNGAESVTSSLGVSTPAEATLTVEPAVAPGFTRAFVPAVVDPGVSSTLIFTIDNSANAIDVGGLTFTDVFPTGLFVDLEPNANSTCGGRLMAAAGAGTMSLRGGVVAAGQTCTISVDVESTRIGQQTSRSSELTSDLPVTTPGASATLTVNEAPLSVSMSFLPSAIRIGRVSRLSYELRNDLTIVANMVSLSDTLPDGLVVVSPPNASSSCVGGIAMVAAGGRGFSSSGGAVRAGETCTIAVDVTSAVAGSYPNSTEGVTSSLGASTPAEATLTVTETDPPLLVSMSFEPSTIDQGGVSRLTYELRNAAVREATSVDLSDTLPAAVVLASVPNAETTCAGGTLTTVAGGGEVSWSGGSLAAGAACTIAVDVTSAVAGSYPNSTEGVTSSQGASTPAEATLTVDAAAAPGFARAFSPATVDPGGVSTLTFMIDNTANAIDVGSLAFDDDFPDGLAVAAPPNAATTCGGAFAPAASATSLAFSGGLVGAGQACTLSVDVQALVAGALIVTSGELTSDLPVTTPGASATLTVNRIPLSISMSFSPSTIGQGEVSRLTYVLRNGALIPATSVSLSDTLPVGVVLASAPNTETTCAGGTLTTVAGGGEVSWSGGSLAAGAACTIAVDVTSTAAGSYPNSTESVTSSLGASTPAEAMLTVNPAAPGFTKAFSPATVIAGEISTLTFTIDNSANTIDVGGLTFTDAFPDGLTVMSSGFIPNECAGSLRIPPRGNNMVFLSRGSVAAGQTCTISVPVRADRLGVLENVSGVLTSDLPVSTPGPSATLTVRPTPLSVSLSFAPAVIAVGRVSRLIYELENTIPAGATAVALSDTLPTGLMVADPPDVNLSAGCRGGDATAAAGGSEVSWSGGAVRADETCTIAVDVTSTVVGSYPNSTESVTSSLGVSTPVEATLAVTETEPPLLVSMSFSPARIATGDVSRLTYELDNIASVAATGVSLSDTLPAGVVLAAVPNARTTCGGTLTAAAGDDDVSWSGGLLAVDSSCTIAVDVTSAAAGSYPNSTESVTSSLGASTTADAALTVIAVPGFTKAFSPATVDVGGISTLTFTIDNSANVIDVSGLDFEDIFPGGLLLSTIRGGFNQCGGGRRASGGRTIVSLLGGSVGAGQTCALSVEVQASQPGALENVTGALTSDLPVDAPGAAATLMVNEVPLTASMAFTTSTIDQGGVSRLIHTLRNGVAVEATSVSLSDTLPDDVTVASTPNAQTTCTSGTLTADAGSNTISFTGGRLGAGASCTIAVDVTSAVAGSYPNVTESVTSSVGVSTPAEATLTVEAPAPGFAKAFSPATTFPGGVSTLTFTIDNAVNLIDVGGLAFDDDFPDGLVVAAIPNGSTTCGGTFAPAASAASLTFTGGSVAAGQSCTLSVDVQALRAGALENVTGDLTSDVPNDAPGASATLTVSEAPLVVVLSFSPSTIGQGGVSRLTYRLRNGTVAATSVALSDTLPDGVVLADPPNAETTCTGGTLTAAAGGSEVSWSDGTVGRGRACTITVDVTSAVVGSYLNDAVSATSSLGATGRPTPATLTVDPAAAPGFARSFSPATVDPGGVSTLTYTIDNTATLIDVGGLAFTDDFPDGLAVAATSNAETTCGGAFAPAASAIALAFTGGRVAAGQSCTLSVDVQALQVGALTGTSGDLTSDLPVATPGASATLTVNEAPLSVSMSFDPSSIGPGAVSRLTYGLDNGAALEATSVDLSDTLPAAVVLAAAPNAATTCTGGTLTATAGGSDVFYSGGSLAAGATCTIAVDVTSAIPGSYPNNAESVTSSLGASTPADAALTVIAVPGFTKAFSPTTVDVGGVSTLTFAIDNSVNIVDVGRLAFTDAFPDGLVMTGTPGASATCGALATFGTSETSLTFTGGSVAAGQTCTISVDVRASRPGILENVSGDLTSDLPDDAPGARATLTVNEVPLSVSMAFEPPTIVQGGVSRLTYTLRNGAAIGATGVALSDTLPADVALASEPNAQTTCTGGTLAAAGGDTITFTGSALGSGASCTIAVDVTSTVAGPYPNPVQSVTSSLGASDPVSATLTVAPAGAPGFSVAFDPPTVDPGGFSTLTFTIDNGANLIGVGSLAFTDSLTGRLFVAREPNIQNTCGGAFAPRVNAFSLTFSGGSVAAGESCIISVDVVAARIGRGSARSSPLTSDLQDDAPGVTATLIVNEVPLLITMAFDPTAIDVNTVSTLSYNLENISAIQASEVSLSDTLPANVVLADVQPGRRTTTNCLFGTLRAVAGADRITYSRGRINVGQTCTITVNVTSAVVGIYPNPIQRVTSSLGASAAAEATLTVNPPVFTRVFSPDTIRQGEETQIVFTIDNGANAIAMTGMAFDDSLPPGVSVAGTPGAGNSCGGAFSPVAGATTLSFADGALAAGATCELRVTVRAIEAGTLTGREVALTSSLATARAAEATLTVDAAEAPVFTRVFSPDTIKQGGETQIVFTVDNGANAIGMTGMAFDDALPPGVSVADTPGVGNSCGGAFDPVAGATTLAFSGGSLAAGAVCEIRVMVRAIGAGTLSGPEVNLTSSIATATAAAATLDVTPADAPGFAKAFLPDTVGPGGVSTLTFTIDNGANLIDVGSLVFTDNFPDGLIVAGPPNGLTTCGGTFAPAASDNALAFTGGGVDAGQTCMISVDVQALRAGALTSTSGDLTSDLPVATSGASATLTVNEAPLTVSMAFDPATIAQGGVSTLSYTLNNGAAVEATSVALSDMLPADVTVAADPDAQTTCTGGALTAPAGGDTISFTGGALAAGAACTITVDVTSVLAGPYPNETESVTSSLGASAPAEATLTVDLTPPTATWTAPTTLTVGVEITAITPAGASADIAVGGYAASGLPAGLIIDANTGIISGAPTTANANVALATITLTDTAGNEAEIDIPFPAVGRGAQTLAGFAYSTETATVGDTLTLTAPTGAVGALSYGSSDPAICTVDSGTGALSLLTAGACMITVTAAQTANYNEATASFTITVNAAGAVSVTLNDPIAGDNIVNIAEQRDGFAITGAADAGATVTVTVGGMAITSTATAAADDTWTITVPGNFAGITGASAEVVATASMGVLTDGEARRTLMVDLTAPTATVSAPTLSNAPFEVTITTDEPVTIVNARGLTVTNGAFADIAGSGATFTATVTPTAPGDVTVVVTAGAFNDAAGNANPASALVTTQFDDVAPTLISLVRSSPATSPTNADTLSWEASFSEAVTGLDGSDFVLTGATATLTVTGIPPEPANPAQAGIRSYTITATGGDLADLNTTIRLAFANNATASDAAGNNLDITGADFSQGAFAIDNTAPGVTITGPATYRVGIPFDVTLSFTEAPLGFSADAMDVTVAGGAISSNSGALTDTGQTLQITPSAVDFATAGEVTVTIVADAFTDAAGNGNDEAAGPAATAVAEPLTLAVIADIAVNEGEDLASPVDIAGLLTNPGNVVVSYRLAGSPPSYAAIDSTTGALEVTAPPFDAATRDTSPLRVEFQVCADAAEVDEVCQTAAVVVTNVNRAPTMATALVDVDIPQSSGNRSRTVDLAGAFEDPDGDELTYTVASITGATTLTAAVSGADLTLTAADATVVETATVTIRATDPDDATADQSFQFSTSDDIAPTATWTAPTTLTVGVEITAITPASPSTDIAVGGYAASGLPAGLTINANTGIISGAPTTANANVALATITLTDTNGNAGTVDLTLPAVGRGSQTLTGFAYSVATATAGDTLTLTAPTGAVGALSYGSSDPAICTVDSDNGALSLLTAGVCTITVTAAQTANYNEATASFTITVNAAGAVSVTLNDPIAGDNIVNIAEQRDGFAITGAADAGATVTVTVGGMAIASTATAAADDTWTITVPGGFAGITGASAEVVATASMGVLTDGEARRTLMVDLTAPTATVSAPTLSNAPFEVTITTDEPVTIVNARGLTVTNGAFADIAGSGATFTATVTPTAPGDVTVAVTAGAFNDAAGNANPASAPVTTQFDDVAPTLISLVRSSPTTSPTNADTLSWEASFSEAVTGLDGSDFVLTGATATLTVTGIPPEPANPAQAGIRSYTITATGGDLADLNTTIRLAFANNATASDAAGNNLDITGADFSQGAFAIDNMAPRVTITGPATYRVGIPFDVTLSFTEAPLGFSADATDVTVAGGAISSNSGALTDTGQTLQITPSAVDFATAGEVTVTIVADAFTDAAGNGNDEAAGPSATAVAEPLTLAVIADIAVNEGEALASPVDIAGLLTNPGNVVVSYRLAGSPPSYAAIDSTTGALEVTAPPFDAATRDTSPLRIEFQVCADAAEVDEVCQTAAVVVTNVNRAPTMATALVGVDIPQSSGNRSRTVDLAGAFEDPDGDELTYTVASITGATTLTAAVSGADLTLTAADATVVETATVTIRATDPDGATADQSFQFSTSDDIAPTATWTAPTTLTVGEAITAIMPASPSADIAGAGGYAASGLPPA